MPTGVLSQTPLDCCKASEWVSPHPHIPASHPCPSSQSSHLQDLSTAGWSCSSISLHCPLLFLSLTPHLPPGVQCSSPCRFTSAFSLVLPLPEEPPPPLSLLSGPCHLLSEVFPATPPSSPHLKAGMAFPSFLSLVTPTHTGPTEMSNGETTTLDLLPNPFLRHLSTLASELFWGPLGRRPRRGPYVFGE